MPDLPLQISVGALPLNQSYTPNEFAQALAERLRISTGQAYSLFTSGAVLPTSDTGPHFLTTESTWYYFDYDTGSYQPIQLNSKSLRYIISAVAPSNNDYDIWYRIAEDGTPLDIRKWQAGQWVAFGVDYANVTNKPNLAPVGVIHQWPTNTAPADFLICNGQAVLRGQYAALFAVIGTTYGAGDGSTTFNLPDFRGRTAVGSGTGDATDATVWNLAAKRGAETHELTEDENGEHFHFGFAAVSTDGVENSLNATSQVARQSFNIGDQGVTLNRTSTAATVGRTSVSGSGTGHNNIQPSLTINYIIRYQN